jgi:hypothetical protein
MIGNTEKPIYNDPFDLQTIYRVFRTKYLVIAAGMIVSFFAAFITEDRSLKFSKKYFIAANVEKEQFVPVSIIFELMNTVIKNDQYNRIEKNPFFTENNFKKLSEFRHSLISPYQIEMELISTDSGDLDHIAGSIMSFLNQLPQYKNKALEYQADMQQQYDEIVLQITGTK